MAKIPSDTKIYSVQPRFYTSDRRGFYSHISDIFSTGCDIPAYGTIERDIYLSDVWANEPMLAGAISTWVEKAQTISWKITGGKNMAFRYAKMLHDANEGKGWSHFQGQRALQYLTADKGTFYELGRNPLSKHLIKAYLELTSVIGSGNPDTLIAHKELLKQLHVDLTSGPVRGVQHLDTTRMIFYGIPNFMWRYYPDHGHPISFPDANLIQQLSIPVPIDRFRGMGISALSRILAFKQLMLGYIVYMRQEIGDIPPEMILLINGLPETYVKDSFNKYKKDRENAGNDTYGKIWWLGSDDPATPISVSTVGLTVPGKSFNYQQMTEIYIKIIAVNTGEDVGEFWLIQHSGATKASQSVQALKARGKGIAKFLHEDERVWNTKVLPVGVTFEYDNKDDAQDAERADIMAKKIGNLKSLAEIAIGEDPLMTMDALKEMAVRWDIVPPEMASEDVPTVVNYTLKELGVFDDRQPKYVVDNDLRMHRIEPTLRGKDLRDANYLQTALKNLYGTKVDEVPVRL